MYTGDHIAISATLAAIASRRFSLNYVTLATCMILANLVDLDHLFYFHLDDGTANSLLLHPLHIYSGILVFACGVFALIKKEKAMFSFLIGFAIATHMCADSLAHFLHYNYTSLFIYDMLELVLMFFVFKKCVCYGSHLKLFSFMVAQDILITFAQWLSLIQWEPQKEIFVYILPNILLVIATSLFWLIFKSKIEMHHSRT